MDKNKRQLIILAAVIMAFIVFFFAAVMKSRSAKKAPAQARGTAAAASANKPAEAPAPGKSSFPSWGRDPFAIGSVPVQATGDLSLSGIFWDAKKPVCLIDGKMLKTGDEISGAKVLEINRDTVLLKVGDEIRTLRVGR